MVESPNYYAIIPADVRYAVIPPNAKLLYGEITALATKEGYCWASDSYFAELYWVKRLAVNRWMKILEDHKFIQRETTISCEWTSRKIFIGEKVIAKWYTGVSKKIQGCIKKDTHSITSNNTINTDTTDTWDTIVSPQIEDPDFFDINGNPVPEIIEVPPDVPSAPPNIQTQEVAVDPKKIRADFLKSLRNALKIAKFKDENEWTEAWRMKTLFDNLWKEVFVYRMKTILSDSFKLKNCNRLSYLRKEIESFINLEIPTNSNVC